MNSREPADRGWAKTADALLRASRADHDPTASDRARVRLALSRRLASGAPVASGGGEHSTPAMALRGALVGNAASLSLAAVCLAAGAFMLAGKDEPQSSPPDTAGVVAHAPASGVLRPTGVSNGSDEQATPSSTPASPSAQAPSNLVGRGAPRQPHAGARAMTAQIVAGGDPSARSEGEPPNAARTAHSASVALPEPAPVPALHADQPDDAAEVALVTRIQRALRNGELSAALALCAEHERRWPHGTFTQEREGVRAIASCQSQSSQARQRARAFLTKYPRATLAPRVNAACATQLAQEPGASPRAK